MAEYDLIIKNGEVFDGSGGPSTRTDIAIRDGVIAKVAPGIGGDADRIIDAEGKIVTPGFVDVHTHYDGQATWDSHLNPSSNLGTTTIVMGNCGVGFAPCKPEDHQVLVQLMEGVEEIPGSAMDEGLPWNWESFPEFLDALEAKPRDIDIAALLPHGPLRVYVMGERAVNREPATEEDIEKMKVLIKEGIEAGAVGFSTSRTLVHRSSSGSFIPTYQAATEELKSLGESLSAERGSVFQMISDWEDADDEFSIIREIAERSGAKGTFTLLDLAPTPDLWHEQLKRIEAAQEAGLDIRGQVISRPVGILMGHPASMHTFYARPTYKALADLPWDERIERLSDPEIKAKILREESEQPHVFVEIFEKRFRNMYPLEDPIEYLPSRDTSVTAMAEKEGREPSEWLYDYFLGNNGNNLVYIPAANFSQNIPELLTHPYTVSALGDGGAHVGSICDTSANIYVLTKWVKDKQQIELSQAINMLCRQPAELYSLHDRGLIKEGMKADVNIINFDELKLRTPHIVHDLPAGGRRFLQNADGIDVTIKAGEVIYENGEATGALPGRLVRSTQLSAQPAA
ncbi:MAG: amidohydrolase family protein [Pseudomonadales bacterium]|jgi:N-acyl-D-amino-acid deacylase|nr:amidohydrolase family protein [Pseudomonadales bacterium]